MKSFKKYSGISWIANKYELEYPGITIGVGSAYRMMSLIEAVAIKFNNDALQTIREEIIDSVFNTVWVFKNDLESTEDPELLAFYNDVMEFLDKDMKRGG